MSPAQTTEDAGAPSNLHKKTGAWVPERVCCQATDREDTEDSHSVSSGGEGYRVSQVKVSNQKG